ncbi:hypothetical protein [Crateriforma conspicua]|uniref:hypothetical protein n=1 Tax=Crateriforma conspicua TaxID=2527996 RepID=UPI00118A9FFD|nr:hypothetical protein [Crateriforma conspicua]QDV61977.1 hypothetical protein Mal65_11050 [Crateriforma conspicua]
MQIQLPAHIEASVIAALQAGEYDRVADEIAAAIRDNAATVTPSVESRAKREIPRIPDSVTIDELAREQGIGPIKDFRDLKADFWPEGETTEAFLAAIRDARNDAEPFVR